MEYEPRMTDDDVKIDSRQMRLDSLILHPASQMLLATF